MPSYITIIIIFIKHILRLSLLSLAVLGGASCDNDYVPLEDRITLSECANSMIDLRTFLSENFPTDIRGAEQIVPVARSWLQLDRRKRYDQFKETLTLCFLQQFKAEENSPHTGPSYSAAYASLVGLDANIRAFDEELSSGASEELLSWRVNAIKDMLTRLYASI